MSNWQDKTQEKELQKNDETEEQYHQTTMDEYLESMNKFDGE